MMAVAIVLAAATAASCAIRSDRRAQGMMKAQDDQARIAVRMMRGDVPYDAAKVDAVFKCLCRYH